MKGDFSRLPFVRSKHYLKVMLQQGRALLDADWNEQQAINTYRMASEARDVVGQCGFPFEDAGFQISPVGLKSGVLVAGEIVVVGDLGKVLRYSLKEDKWLEPDNSSVNIRFNAICAAIGGFLWAAGDRGTLQCCDCSKITDNNEERPENLNNLSWQQKNSGVMVNFNGVAASSVTVWAVGDEGTIVCTKDAGKSWQREDSDVFYDLNAIFVNQSGGWVVGEVGTILRWEKAGTWHRQNSGVTVELHGVFFINNSLTGWVVGDDGTILHTANGGISWVSQNSPTFLNLYAVCFADEKTGWVVGEDGIVLSTTDGGLKWIMNKTDSDRALRTVLIDPKDGSVYLTGDVFKLYRYRPYNGLYAEYYNDDKECLVGLPKVTRVDAQINCNWQEDSPVPGVIGVDHFSIRWSGWLKTTEAGEYSFRTFADDGVRVWVDDKIVIDHWYDDNGEKAQTGVVKLDAGVFCPIRVQYYENGGSASIKLQWKRNKAKDEKYKAKDEKFRFIPTECLTPYLHPLPEGMPFFMVPGLKGEYFKDSQNQHLQGAPFSLRFDPNIDFSWNQSGPMKGIEEDNFSVRWTGWLRSSESGWHTLSTCSDDGVRLWLEGVKLIDHWDEHKAKTDSAKVKLQSGKLYLIRVEYFEAGGDATMQLSWRLPSQANEAVIPWSCFFREAGPCWQDLTSQADKIPLLASAGKAYVDGILCEAELAVAVEDDIEDLSGDYLAYLDVWQRQIAAFQDADLHEPALGEADTATRSQVVWKVKLCPLIPQPGVAELDLAEWRGLNASRTAFLTAVLTGDVGVDTACQLAPDAKYRGLENQLYRVEIHNDEKGKETFKWSRDNGSEVFPIKSQDSQRVIIDPEHPGRIHDLCGSDQKDLYLELCNDDTELGILPGVISKPSDFDSTQLALMLDVELDVVSKYCVKGKRPFLRRWNSGEVQVTGDDIPLENGLSVRFNKQGRYQRGDYWLIPARTANGGTILWPQHQGSSLPQKPHGVDHRYCQLAYLTCSKGQGKVVDIRDLRKIFYPAVGHDRSELQVPACHVRSISWGHDLKIPRNTFKKGLAIGFDMLPDLASINDATLVVTCESGGQSFIVSGSCDLDLIQQGLRWVPDNKLADAIAQGARVRVVLKGEKILTLPDPTGRRYHLDGQALSAPRHTDSAGALQLSLPSGSGREASDFESWCYLSETADTLLVESINFYSWKRTNAVSLQFLQKESSITDAMVAAYLSLDYRYDVSCSGAHISSIEPPLAIELCFSEELSKIDNNAIELFMRQRSTLSADVTGRILHETGRLQTTSSMSGTIIPKKDGKSLFFICFRPKTKTPTLLAQGLYNLVAHAQRISSHNGPLDGDFDNEAGGDFSVTFEVGRGLAYTLARKSIVKSL